MISHGIGNNISDLILFSQCPAKYFYKASLGIEHSNSTPDGALTSAFLSSLHSYISDKYISKAKDMFETMATMSLVVSKDDTNVINKYRAMLDTAINRFSIYGSYTSISPYEYTLDINGTVYSGNIDAVLYPISSSKVDTNEVIVIDMSKRATANDMLYSYRTNIAAYVCYNNMGKFTMYRYNPYNNDYNSIDVSYTKSLEAYEELCTIESVYRHVTENGLWYRSRGYWCSSCYAAGICDSVQLSGLHSID